MALVPITTPVLDPVTKPLTGQGGTTRVGVLSRIGGITKDLGYGAAPLAAGVTALTAATTLTSATSGYWYRLTGSFAVTLPASSGATTATPYIYSFFKNDGSGVCVLTAAGSDTFDSGLATARVYQERVQIITYGDGIWYFLERQNGWINLVSNAAIPSATTLDITNFANDSELSDINVSADGLTFSAAAILVIKIARAGTIVTTAYTYSQVYASSTTAAAGSGSTSGTYLPLSSSTANAMAVDFNLKNPAQTTAALQTMWYNIRYLTTGAGHTRGDCAVGSSTGAVTTIRLSSSNEATAFSGGRYGVRGFRA